MLELVGEGIAGSGGLARPAVAAFVAMLHQTISVDQKLTCLGCKGAPEWGEREMILSFLGINKA